MGDAQSTPSNGVVQGYNGNNSAIIYSMTAFAAITWYNAIELLVLIPYVFKKYEGTYFWSLLLTTFSLIPYQFGAWTKQNIPSMPHLVPVAFTNIFWLVLIPGESLVLWSRLHLVTENQKLLRFVRLLIIATFFLFCIPTTILTYGANIESPSHDRFVRGFEAYEKIQMTVFSAQEIFISSIYLYEVRKIYRMVFEGNTRRIMWELAVINIMIIVMDLAMVVVEYLNLFQIQTTMKGMIYSIKLKLEFGVLSKLVKVVTSRHNSGRMTAEENSVDLSRLPSGMGFRKKTELDDSGTRELVPGVKGLENAGMPSDNNLPPEWRQGPSELPFTTYHSPAERTVARARSSSSSSSSSSHSEISYPGRLG